jgi:Flp pilus assembly protein TadD
MVNMAMVQKHMGQFDKATALLEEVINKINPRDHAAINNMANILHEQGKHEQAAVMYLQALEIEPNDDDTLCNLAMAL